MRYHSNCIQQHSIDEIETLDFDMDSECFIATKAEAPTDTAPRLFHKKHNPSCQDLK